jgi:hypothetical protein
MANQSTTRKHSGDTLHWGSSPFFTQFNLVIHISYSSYILFIGVKQLLTGYGLSLADWRSAVMSSLMNSQLTMHQFTTTPPNLLFQLTNVLVPATNSQRLHHVTQAECHNRRNFERNLRQKINLTWQLPSSKLLWTRNIIPSWRIAPGLWYPSLMGDQQLDVDGRISWNMVLTEPFNATRPDS